MIKIFVYTAFNGYAWHGCDEQTANDLRSFMEATGTLPKGASDRPPYGGAVRCIIGGETGTGVYRYLIRERGDAFGRDSMYLSFAFVPSSDGRVDFVRLLECPEMAEPRPGEPKVLSLDASRFPLKGEAAIPANAQGVWWTHSNSFKLTRDVINEAARLFFLPESHLGLLRAVFEKEEGGFSAQVEYSVFRQVEEFERRRRELDQHPGSSECAQSFSAALDALNQRAGALGGFEGFRKFAELASNRGAEVAEREQMKNGVMAAVQHATDVAHGFSVNCAEWTSCPAQVDDTVLKRELAALDSAAMKAAAVIAADDKLKQKVAEVHAGLTGQIIRIGQFNTQVREALNGTASDLRPAMLRLLMSRAVDPGPFFKGLAEWARRQFERRSKPSFWNPNEPVTRQKNTPSSAKGHSVISLIISFICGATLSLLVIWFVQKKLSANPEQVPSVNEVSQKPSNAVKTVSSNAVETVSSNAVETVSSNAVKTASSSAGVTVSSSVVETVSSNAVETVSSNAVKTASSSAVETVLSSNAVKTASSNIVARLSSNTNSGTRAEAPILGSGTRTGVQASSPVVKNAGSNGVPSKVTKSLSETKDHVKKPESKQATGGDQPEAVVSKRSVFSKNEKFKSKQQQGTSGLDSRGKKIK